MHRAVVLFFLVPMISLLPREAGAETLNFSGRLEGQSRKPGWKFLVAKSHRQIFGWIGSQTQFVVRGSVRGTGRVRAAIFSATTSGNEGRLTARIRGNRLTGNGFLRSSDEAQRFRLPRTRAKTGGRRDMSSNTRLSPLPIRSGEWVGGRLIIRKNDNGTYSWRAVFDLKTHPSFTRQGIVPAPAGGAMLRIAVSGNRVLPTAVFHVDPQSGWLYFSARIPRDDKTWHGAVKLHASRPSPEPPTPFVARSFATDHTETFGGRTLTYRATAADTVFTNADGKPAATMFSFSYMETPVRPEKPVLFVYNGGPGSSSIWLHMGMLGPRRIVYEDPIHPRTVPPFTVEQNPRCPLDLVDLVFIDPVGTGYSKLLPAGKATDFYGVEEDAQAMADFITAWLTRNGRWNSPRLIIGESYGAIRSAVLANKLTGGPLTGSLNGATLNGALLLGPSLETGIPSLPGTEVEKVTSLPSFTAAAWYHGRIDPGAGLAETVSASRAFAGTDYLLALAKGSALTPDARQEIAATLASYTGIPGGLWVEKDLRLEIGAFMRTLLADEGLEIGGYDSRYTLPLRPSGGDPVADDAAMAQYTPGFVAAFNEWTRNGLKVQIDEPYRPIVFQPINALWNWGLGPGMPSPPHNYAEDLAIAMRRNPSLLLFVGSGYYDLVTTMDAADYALAHAGLPSERVTRRIYESGHMPYLGEESADQLNRDVRAFIESALP